MERDMCPIGLSPASGTRLLVHVSQETWGAPVSLTITFQYQNSSDPALSIHSCKYKPSKTSCWSWLPFCLEIAPHPAWKQITIYSTQHNLNLGGGPNHDSQMFKWFLLLFQYIRPGKKEFLILVTILTLHIWPEIWDFWLKNGQKWPLGGKGAAD